MSTHSSKLAMREALFRVYLKEAFDLCRSIGSKCANLFQLAEVNAPAVKPWLSCRPEIHDVIRSTLIDCANLKKLISTNAVKLKDESSEQYALRLARTEYVRAAIGDLPIEEMLNQRVRNTLEHFDEYWDSAILEIVNERHGPNVFAAFNIVISSWDVMTPPPLPIKLYVADERKFYNFRWSVDLDALKREADQIAARVAQHPAVIDASGGCYLIRIRQ